MQFRTISLALFTLAIAACIPHKPVTHIDGDWSSPLDRDLTVAAAHMEEGFKAKGWDVHVLWIGSRGAEYSIERGPTGEPVRKEVMVMYGFQMPNKKCYLHGEGVLAQHVMLAREHLGGGQYGEPRVIGYDPIKGDGNPVGHELICDAADSVKGGVHAPFGASARR